MLLNPDFLIHWPLPTVSSMVLESIFRWDHRWRWTGSPLFYSWQ